MTCWVQGESKGLGDGESAHPLLNTNAPTTEVELRLASEESAAMASDGSYSAPVEYSCIEVTCYPTSEGRRNTRV